MAYPEVKKLIKIKVLDGFDSIFCYLAAKTYGYICLAGSRKFIRSVIIWVQDTALNYPKNGFVLDELAVKLISTEINS